MILSDIDVHKEQYGGASFFDRNNVESVVKVLDFVVVISIELWLSTILILILMIFFNKL